MKVIAFNGSPRKDGNTSILIGYVLEELKKAGISTELIDLAGKKLHGCIACYRCAGNQDRQYQPDDRPGFQLLEHGHRS